MRPAASPVSSISSRAAVVASSSPATSRRPAGSSRRSTVERGAELADQGDRVVVVEGHDGHRAGVVDDVPLELGAVRLLGTRPGPR